MARFNRKQRRRLQREAERQQRELKQLQMKPQAINPMVPQPQLELVEKASQWKREIEEDKAFLGAPPETSVFYAKCKEEKPKWTPGAYTPAAPYVKDAYKAHPLYRPPVREFGKGEVRKYAQTGWWEEQQHQKSVGHGGNPGSGYDDHGTYHFGGVPSAKRKPTIHDQHPDLQEDPDTGSYEHWITGVEAEERNETLRKLNKNAPLCPHCFNPVNVGFDKDDERYRAECCYCGMAGPFAFSAEKALEHFKAYILFNPDE